jgi:hypothetical protein
MGSGGVRMKSEKEKLAELEILASEWIIGYKPLTKKQKRIVLDIRNMEGLLEQSRQRTRRLERIIDVLYKILSELK